jgi:hypothetical protein
MVKPARSAHPAPGSTKAKALLSVVATAKKISAAARERAESLLEEIGRRKKRIGEDFYDIGLALRELLKKKLYQALGYASFGAMLKTREVMSEAQAHKLIQLVESVPRTQAIAYGQEKAIALINYAKATPELDTPKLLMEGGALPSGKRVAEASVREVKEASRNIRKTKGSVTKKSPAEVEALREARATQAWLRGLGARKAAASAIKRDGAWWVRVEMPVLQSSRVRG